MRMILRKTPLKVYSSRVNILAMSRFTLVCQTEGYKIYIDRKHYNIKILYCNISVVNIVCLCMYKTNVDREKKV